MNENDLSGIIIGAAIEVHKCLGPGLLEAGYRLDFLVCDKVIVEVKAIEKLQPIHNAQLISYLRLCNKKLGLLINFNSVVLKNGIKRVVNNL